MKLRLAFKVMGHIWGKPSFYRRRSTQRRAMKRLGMLAPPRGARGDTFKFVAK